MAPTDAPATYLASLHSFSSPAPSFLSLFFLTLFPLPFILPFLFLKEFLLPLVFHVDKHNHATLRY